MMYEEIENKIMGMIGKLPIQEQLSVMNRIVHNCIVIAVETEEPDLDDKIDTFVYNLYSSMYTPPVVAFHLGLVGQKVLQANPGLEQQLMTVVEGDKSKSYID